MSAASAWPGRQVGRKIDEDAQDVARHIARAIAGTTPHAILQWWPCDEAYPRECERIERDGLCRTCGGRGAGRGRRSGTGRTRSTRTRCWRRCTRAAGRGRGCTQEIDEGPVSTLLDLEWGWAWNTTKSARARSVGQIKGLPGRRHNAGGKGTSRGGARGGRDRGVDRARRDGAPMAPEVHEDGKPERARERGDTTHCAERTDRLQRETVQGEGAAASHRMVPRAHPGADNGQGQERADPVGGRDRPARRRREDGARARRMDVQRRATGQAARGGPGPGGAGSWSRTPTAARRAQRGRRQRQEPTASCSNETRSRFGGTAGSGCLESRPRRWMTRGWPGQGRSSRRSSASSTCSTRRRTRACRWSSAVAMRRTPVGATNAYDTTCTAGCAPSLRLAARRAVTEQVQLGPTEKYNLESFYASAANPEYGTIAHWDPSEQSWLRPDPERKRRGTRSRRNTEKLSGAEFLERAREVARTLGTSLVGVDLTRPRTQLPVVKVGSSGAGALLAPAGTPAPAHRRKRRGMDGAGVRGGRSEPGAGDPVAGR